MLASAQAASRCVFCGAKICLCPSFGQCSEDTAYRECEQSTQLLAVLSWLLAFVVSWAFAQMSSVHPSEGIVYEGVIEIVGIYLQGLQNPDGSVKTECGIHVADDVKG